MDAKKPVTSTDGVAGKTVRPNRQKDAGKQRVPDSERLVVSWFGWDIAHHELISEDAFQAWVVRLREICHARGWVIERLGSAIDLIFGCPTRSITRREFFQFQRDWDALNREFGFRFSGLLGLITATNKHSGDLPLETYVAGSKRHGDSIGRPQRHQRKTKKATAPPKEPAPPRLAEGIAGRVLRANMPKRTHKEAMAEADRRRKALEPELERLRRDKSWNRSCPRSGLQVKIAVEELMADKSWDRSAPKDWLHERAVFEEERERQRKKSQSRKKKR